MFHIVLRVICVSLCIEGYVFQFVLRVIRVSLCVKGNTCFTLC